MTSIKAERVVQVGLGERSYPIIIQEGLINQIGRDLQEKKVAKRYGVISDDHVASLYAEQLMTSLAEAGIAAELITFPRGEENKNLQTLSTLCSELATRNFDRKDGLIALGSGSGFCMTPNAQGYTVQCAAGPPPAAGPVVFPRSAGTSSPPPPCTRSSRPGPCVAAQRKYPRS